MTDVQVLAENTSLNDIEASAFLNILFNKKEEFDPSSYDEILDEFQNNWQIFDDYNEAFKDSKTKDSELSEEEFKLNTFILPSKRCLVSVI